MKTRKLKMPRLNFFICFFIAFVMFLVFIAATVMGRNKPSIFAEISEIAADGTYVYTIDDRNNTLCQYTNNGERVWSTSFNSTGDCRIFCDGSGSVCRFDVRRRTVYVYDGNGNIISSYEATRDDLEAQGFFKKYEQKRTEISLSEGIDYALEDRLIVDSEITVTPNGETASFTVEPWFGHMLWYACLLVFAFLMMCGVYDLACLIIGQKTEDGNI